MNNIEILEDYLKFIKQFDNNSAFIPATENLIQEYKELKDTLKQTQDSWYEDTKKIELNNECEIALNNRILDLEQENKELKERCLKLESDRFWDNVIPKSKVKEKIEELDKKMAEDEVDEFGIHSQGWAALDWTRDFLLKLLEEGE